MNGRADQERKTSDHSTLSTDVAPPEVASRSTGTGDDGQRERNEAKAMVVVLMGPMGCGKTTVGRLLSARLGWPFMDGDDFHPRENVEKMGAGIALDDEDRRPWLERLHAEIQGRLSRGQSTIVACSALKKVYRDIIGVNQTTVVTVYLKGTYDLLRERIEQRRHPYMSRDLLRSQLDTLEEPEGGLWVDVARPPEEIARSVVESLGLAP
jgi:carbohydrate kinase (thermoresistant glucokinase family)